jgi:tetratricopeptide (TPR) repeat protein
MAGLPLWQNYSRSGKSFLRMGRYAEAERMFASALQVAEEFGPKDPHLGVSLLNLARACQAMGRFEKAESLLARALAIAETEHGPDHVDVAATCNSLGGLAPDKAEPCYKRALAIMEKAFGPQHASVLTVLENYAAMLRKAGRTAESGDLEGRVLAARNQAAKDPGKP